MPTSWSGGNNPIPGWAGNPTGAPLTDAQKKRKMDLLSGGRSGGGDMPAPIPALGGAQTPVPPVRMEQPRGTQQPSNILMLARADQRAAGKYNFLPWECTGDGQARMQTSFAPSLLNGGKLMVEITNSAGNNTQSANTVYAGPTSGGAASPNFRALVTADIPNLGITAGKLATGSVYEDAIQAASVTTAKIADANVTPAKVSTAVPQMGKNKIINGAMDFWQRGNALTTITSGSEAYLADRYVGFRDSDGTIQQGRDTDVPSYADCGAYISYSHRMYASTADSSLTSDQRYLVAQRIEGYNCRRLYGGFVFSFWLKASKAGTITVWCYDYGATQYYLATISATTSWARYSVTVPANTSGTKSVTTSSGILVGLVYGCSTASATYYAGTTGAWTSGGKQAATGQTNMLDTNGYSVWTTLWQVEEGASRSDFEFRPVAEELVLCQRYYEEIGGVSDQGYGVLWCNSTTTAEGFFGYSTKRGTPSVTVSAASDFRVLYGAGSVAAATALNRYNPTVNGVVLSPTVGSAVLTAGQAAQLQSNTTVNTRLKIDAEL